jgi:hypothetical protein
MAKRRPRLGRVSAQDMRNASTTVGNYRDGIRKMEFEAGKMKAKVIEVGFIGAKGDRVPAGYNNGRTPVKLYMMYNNFGAKSRKLPARPFFDRAIKRYNNKSNGPFVEAAKYINQTGRIRGDRVAKVMAKSMVEIIKRELLNGRFKKKSSKSREPHGKPLSLSGLAADSLSWRIK